MKTNIIFIGIAVFLYAFFHISSARAETLPQVIISEIQITGGTKATKDEFVELYNPGGASVDISGWELRRKTKSDTSVTGELFHKFIPVDCKTENPLALTDTIPANGYLLWTNKDGAASFTDLFDVRSGNKTSPNLAENNGLALFDGKSVLIDGITWDVCPPEDSSTDCFSKENIFASPATYIEKSPTKWNTIVRDIVSNTWNISSSPPTPEKTGEKTCPVSTNSAESSKAPSTIRLNEIFPDPSAKSDAGEFIELYNFGTESVDISGWEILDAAALKKRSNGESFDRLVFPSVTVINPDTYHIAIDTDPWFSLTLNNTDETLSLFDKNEILIDSLHFDKSKKDISLNYTLTGWRGGTPTPGAENQLNSLPETREKVPKKGFKGAPVAFSARGKDADGDTLKYTWDFGDGHKSYKAATSHTYEKNGVYAVTLKTTDGSDDLIETFAIEIRSYKPPEVRITALLPNPEGSDTDNEWILIENREKKEINLKNFGIATGWKNLANHPVREDFIIPPKKEARLTRMHSLFTLPNQKGKIELRAPDGKVLQKIRYKLEKSIAEDVVYQKKKGEKWSFASSAGKNTVTEIAPAATVSAEAAEESPEEEDAPDADTQPEDEPDFQETDGEVLGASITAEMQAYRYARNRQWMKLLNFGTRAALPDNIVFAPGNASAPSPKESLIPAASSPLLPTINASINTLINALR